MTEAALTDTIDGWVSGWTIAWLALLYCDSKFWNYIVREIPRSQSRIGRFLLLLSFGGILFLTLLCFRFSLRVILYWDFGFYLGILIPSIVHWLSLAHLAFGFLKTAVLVAWHLPRKRTQIALRAFLPCQFSFFVLHLASAAAYSCPVGLLLCVFALLLFLFEADSVPPVSRLRQQREKWE